jgi:protein TonB
MEKAVTSLARTSKAFGFAVTAMLHCGMILAYFFVVPYALPIALPPPVEALRITLAEPIAVSSPPQTASIPDPPTPTPGVEQSTPPKTVQQEQKVPVTPKKDFPSKPPEVQPKPVPPQESLAQAVSKAPVAIQQRDDGSLASVQKIEEARQTLLSALIASLEREKRYPTAARRLGIEGRVIAEVRVDSKGPIISISVKSNTPQEMLERATLEALQRVRNKWSPVQVPESMTLNIPILYSLKK